MKVKIEKQNTIKLIKSYIGAAQTIEVIEGQTIEILMPEPTQQGSGMDLIIKIEAPTITWAEGKAKDLNGVTHVELTMEEETVQFPIKGAITNNRFGPRDTPNGVEFQINVERN